MKNKLSVFLLSIFGGVTAFFFSQLLFENSNDKEIELMEKKPKKVFLLQALLKLSNKIINGSDLDFTVAAEKTVDAGTYCQ